MVRLLMESWSGVDETDDPAAYVRFADTLRGGRDDDPETFRPLLDLLGFAPRH